LMPLVFSSNAPGIFSDKILETHRAYLFSKATEISAING